ncbi:MAG: acyl-CoA dehydrogenase [Alphaproteobacteria bacterium]|nr:acyl-CoA dehydrogenase [Alphaproteobacteria bacterium]
MADTILYDSALRLFGDFAASQRPEQAGADAKPWAAPLWEAVEQAGYLDVLAEGPAGMSEAATILRAAGHHAAPLPLPETMLARWLCRAAGMEPPAGALTVAPVEPGDRILRVADVLAGRAGYVPWGRDAAAVVLIGEATLFVAPRADIGIETDLNLAGEPRDHLVAVARDVPSAPLPEGIDKALLLRLGGLARAAQMAGAMQAALELSTRYANDRVQFGRPIAKFQAIQQQMAVLAEETAAALVAVENAALAVAEARPSAGFAMAAAKIRAGEAAGKVAEIAHQVHGAMGFTQEHSLHRLTVRLWSWRDEFGSEAHWSHELGRIVAAAGPDGLWPLITAA